MIEFVDTNTSWRSWEKAWRLAGIVGRSLTEALFPAKCLVCSEFIDTPSLTPVPRRLDSTGTGGRLRQCLEPFVCRSCMTGIKPVTAPMCDSCGQVFASRVGSDHLCEGCIRAPNYFQKARSALIYTDSCARLVHSFKYNGKIQLARPLGMLLCLAYRFFWSAGDIDLILPVPLHRHRLKQRGFNQVVLMMRQWALTAESKSMPDAVAFDWDILERVVHTRPQTSLGRNERPINLRSAFGLKKKSDVTGLRLLVVDDVYTTGTTANECARLLHRNGAARVDVLTLARAV